LELGATDSREHGAGSLELFKELGAGSMQLGAGSKKAWSFLKSWEQGACSLEQESMELRDNIKKSLERGAKILGCGERLKAFCFLLPVPILTSPLFQTVNNCL
jgi:hypothetical protein